MKKGFTIVELLIVIVVIAILAAISVVAYNGIQSRSKNSKTFSAVGQWVKAMELYKVDRGVYPPQSSCLGSMTTYPSNVCDGASTGVTTAFLNAMNEYTSGSSPEPDTTDIDPSSDVRSGAVYNAPVERIYYTILGSYSGTCPAVGGKSAVLSNNSLSGGYRCYIQL